MMSLYEEKSPPKDKDSERHRQLYKSPPIVGCWKENYRQRCKERLKKSREKFLSNIRDLQTSKEEIVSDLMQEEWSCLRREYLDLTIEEADELMDDIRKELQAQIFLQECEELQAGFLDFTQVVCPICKMNSLQIHGNRIVWCSCGVCLHTEVEITLKKLQEFIMTAWKVHADTCSRDPKFSLSGVTEATNLLLTCQDCDLMYYVV